MDHDENLFSGQRFRVVRRKQTLPDGVEKAREVILHPGAVVILPLLPPDQVVLIRNYRAAVNQTLWELPAGTLEVEEEPLVAAHRELEEETGYRAGSLKFVHAFWMSPGILCERMHLFVARDLMRGSQHLDAGEQIEPRIVAWHEALQLVRTGEIQDAKTLVGLLWAHSFQAQS